MSAAQKSLEAINAKYAADSASAAADTTTGTATNTAKTVKFSTECSSEDKPKPVEKNTIGNQKKWFDELCHQIEATKNYGKSLHKVMIIEHLDSNGEPLNKNESENNAIYELTTANNEPDLTDIMDLMDGGRLENVYRIVLSATDREHPIKISKTDPYHPNDDVELEGAELDFSDGNLQILIAPKKALTATK